MKPWHQVIVPHADIRAGKFDESVFAADLSDVVADRGPLVIEPPVLQMLGLTEQDLAWLAEDLAKNLKEAENFLVIGKVAKP